ncbi:hypothetical protein AWENTII_001767 [Aspergillus wentii]
MVGSNYSDNMDRMECSAVYIDDRVKSERWVHRRLSDASTTSSGSVSVIAEEPESLRSDVELLLQVCKQIYLCHAGTSFATKLAELSDRAGYNCTPVFAFFDIDLGTDEIGPARRKISRASWSETSPPSPSSLRHGFTFSSQSEETYGLQLLSGVSADIQVQESPNVIVPVAVLRTVSAGMTSSPVEQPSRNILTADPHQITRCLDAGAVEVLTTPLDRSRVQGLVVHAYRTRKSAQKEQSRFLARRKLRKHSWVGVHDEQPYAYLREAMVSKLMKGICDPEEVIEEFQDRELDVSPEREKFVKQQIGNWNFKAHEFSEDELVFGACEMLQHAFQMPELEHWRLTPGELRTFLLACRAAYNSFVLYHNFRHAIDVLQSVFCFLLHIGALPPYSSAVPALGSSTPIASLLAPFDALTLLISAIGHDVGHPGVNNFFLVKLNSPLAQLYNDNSVLEAFHCAAFSQILRRHWPAAFKDKQLRKLLISSILATDMGVHQKFMERLGSLQERFYENNKTVDGWKVQDIEMYKSLLCGLLIKCADISNVARPWEVAEKWTKILQEEFANQGEMEKEVGMETALFGGPPELGNIYKLATGQIGFMSIFALPLFEGVSDILPQLKFTAEQIRSNQAKWHFLADLEKRKQILQAEIRSEDTVSPRSSSPPSESREVKERRSAPVGTPKPPPETPNDLQHATTETGDDSDYFGSTHSPSQDSVEQRAINENTISPVVSPDTPGPSMDITGSPYPPGTPSRKSSTAVPDLTMVSLASRPDRNAPPIHPPQGDQQPTLDPNRARDPAVLAAVIFANASMDEGEAQDPSRNRDHSLDNASERPSSSRHGPQGQHRQHANTGSSVRTSAPSTSQRNSCTRTQSISAYSNNMTPISPATNATSFLTVDSGDDKGVPRDSTGEHEHHDSTSTRASSSNAYTPVDREHQGTYSSSGQSHVSRASHTSHNSHRSHRSDQHVDDGNKNHVMATVFGNGRGSSSKSTTTAGSVKNDGHHHGNHHGEESPGEHTPPRRLPKRRSRLRLAFWKRRNHHAHQEVSGET